MDSPQNIWYPFTQMKLAPDPIKIISGNGAELTDENGLVYIDAISSWWTNIHGHSHPYVGQKINEQFLKLEHVIFAGFTHQPALTLADRLLKILSGDFSKIFFSDNGSTSVEVAIKMAIQYWANLGIGRKKIIAFRNSYHGDTFGSMSVSERGPFTAAFHNLLFDVEFITPPFAGKETESIDQFINLADENAAAFIYEPLVMGAGGMLMYDATYLDELLEIAKSKKIICIADEVMTGFYRTGKFFASDYCNNKPDLVCLSKGLTGGVMAMGITAAPNFIFDAFYDDDKFKALYHGHSFTANPLACTAANASLDLIEEEGFENKISNITGMHKEFTSTLKKYKLVENIRQTGTIIAFDIKIDGETNYFNSIRDEIYNYFISHGALLRPLGNTIYLMPPYCITSDQLNILYQSIINFLDLKTQSFK